MRSTVTDRHAKLLYLKNRIIIFFYFFISFCLLFFSFYFLHISWFRFVLVDFVLLLLVSFSFHWFHFIFVDFVSHFIGTRTDDTFVLGNYLFIDFDKKIQPFCTSILLLSLHNWMTLTQLPLRHTTRISTMRKTCHKNNKLEKKN